MNGGVISGNTANWGGGVNVRDGTFSKASGGIIYGDTDTPHTPGSTENTAGTGNGHAVHFQPGGKKRNSTAGEGVTMDGRIAGSDGGWD